MTLCFVANENLFIINEIIIKKYLKIRFKRGIFSFSKVYISIFL